MSKNNAELQLKQMVGNGTIKFENNNIVLDDEIGKKKFIKLMKEFIDMESEDKNDYRDLDKGRKRNGRRKK